VSGFAFPVSDTPAASLLAPARDAHRPRVGVRGPIAAGVALAIALCALADEPPACLLFQPGADAAPTQTCLACHTLSGPGNHTVDVRYATRHGRDLRPAEEVVRRGVHLPDGEIRCTTCHDPRSPWKHHIALPPGAKAVKAVDLRTPASYEQPPAPARPGDAVSPKPLCLACHAFD
jgi:cytochrome c peroxidase